MADAAPVSGAEGYAEEAPELFRLYESLPFAGVHKAVLHLLLREPSHVLDIGSGTGRDAAAFAAMGHRVVAVEPTHELRAGAMALHPSPRIEWLDDSLPGLRRVGARGETFDVVMLSAVWMHLDVGQRRQAMPVVASLVREGGVLIVSLRHGPVPPGRRMFEVSAEETIALAEAEGMTAVVNENAPSLRDPHARWTRLAFRKVGAR